MLLLPCRTLGYVPPASCAPRASLSTRASPSSTTHTTGRPLPGLTSTPCCLSNTGTPRLAPAAPSTAAVTQMLLMLGTTPSMCLLCGQQLIGSQGRSRCVVRGCCWGLLGQTSLLTVGLLVRGRERTSPACSCSAVQLACTIDKEAALGQTVVDLLLLGTVLCLGGCPLLQCIFVNLSGESSVVVFRSAAPSSQCRMNQNE
jgi:hypothetical protein